MGKSNAVKQKLAKDTKEIRELSDVQLHVFVQMSRIGVFKASQKLPDPERSSSRDFESALLEVLVRMDDLRHGEEEQQRRWYGQAGQQ